MKRPVEINTFEVISLKCFNTYSILLELFMLKYELYFVCEVYTVDGNAEKFHLHRFILPNSTSYKAKNHIWSSLAHPYQSQRCSNSELNNVQFSYIYNATVYWNMNSVFFMCYLDICLAVISVYSDVQCNKWRTTVHYLN